MDVVLVIALMWIIFSAIYLVWALFECRRRGREEEDFERWEAERLD